MEFLSPNSLLRLVGITSLVLIHCVTSWSQEVEAVVGSAAGSEFGVGRVILSLDETTDLERLRTHLMSVDDRDGRVLYPAIRYTKPLGLLMEVLGVDSVADAPNQLHVHFLFTGNEPFDLELSLPQARTVRIVPTRRRFAYQRLLRAWWVRYKAATRQRLQGADYSPVVETYLTSMLSRRMRLAPPPRSEIRNDGRAKSLLLRTEPLRLAMLAEAVEGRVDRRQPMALPLPAPILWPEDQFDSISEVTEIEPIAMMVPEECFYIRFATFENYIWLRKLLEEYGGDLSRMVMLRGTDSQLNQRVENQLGLRESSLSRILGPQVISDVALLGRDTYLEEGAAIGILFEAKNSLLANELTQQRKRRLQELQESGAQESTFRVKDVDVSFARTPDNRMRSFYVSAGKYHLVTNCRQIVDRFVECAQGVRSLGASNEYRHARTLIPQGEENTLFVYLSRRFFEGLLSPQYQIELPRRLRAVTDLQAWELATLAARAEGLTKPVGTERLIEYGFLAADGNARSDGSMNVAQGDRMLDSIRGARGTFLPIPDVKIANVTATEAESFEKTTWYHQTLWKQMDPVLIGIRRTALNDATERVAIQARMLPLNKDKYGLYTEIFGPPSDKRIKPPEDDIVSIQAYVDGGALAVPPHHFYFGLRDQAPNLKYSQRKFLKSLQVMRTAPAYAAAWPRPGVLDRLGLSGADQGDGFRSMMLGLVRMDATNDFSLLSFDKQILADVAPKLSVERVETPSQVHVRVGDIKESKFGKWAGDLDFQRAWDTSMGNVHLMHLLKQQLRVPLPEAESTAERILNAKLICPLGGKYQTQQEPDGSTRWASTAGLDGVEACRADYVSPLMAWLRGLEFQVTIEEDRIVAEGTLDIEREQTSDGITLPKFDFFGRRKN